MKPTPDQHRNLRWLSDRGGSGYLDRYGRLCAGGDQAPQGAMVSWLFLIAKGLLRGGEDRLIITEAGTTFLAAAKEAPSRP